MGKTADFLALGRNKKPLFSERYNLPLIQRLINGY